MPEDQLPIDSSPDEPVPQDQSVPEDAPDAGDATNHSKTQEQLPDKQIPQQESNMEVHHHAHHAHGKKNWKSYFWEFLMLFLAVFCGFLAEYALEHQIEHERERQFMASLVEDLHKDTVQMNEVIDLGKSQVLLMDTLLSVLNADEQVTEFVMKVYLLQANSTRVVNMEFEDRTSSQLKNAGGMRLIRQADVVDSILGYWDNIEVAYNISARMERLNQVRGDIAVKLFHQKYLIRNTERPFSPIKDIRADARLIDDNPALLAEYANRSSSRKIVLENYIRTLTGMKEQAAYLAKQIQQAYNLH